MYRRFYIIKGETKSYPYIAEILAKICDQYNLTSTLSLVTALDPDNRWPYEAEKIGYYQFCMRVLISKIRFTTIDKLPGYVPTAMFRKLQLETTKI